jgi:hypothetical protein
VDPYGARVSPLASKRPEAIFTWLSTGGMGRYIASDRRNIKLIVDARFYGDRKQGFECQIRYLGGPGSYSYQGPSLGRKLRGRRLPKTRFHG